MWTIKKAGKKGCLHLDRRVVLMKSIHTVFGTIHIVPHPLLNPDTDMTDVVVNRICLDCGLHDTREWKEVR